jgi:putative ABC transport system permease protein
VYLNGSTATMNNWMYESVAGELAKYMGKIYIQQGSSSYPPFDSTISEKKAEEIMGLNDSRVNFEESAPLIFIRIERGMMPFMSAEAMVIGVPVGKEPVLLGDLGAASGISTFPEGADNLTILGNQAAEYYNAGVGDEIKINGQILNVIGVLEEATMNSVNISAIVSLPTAQHLFSKEETVSAVLLTAKDVTDVGKIASTITAKYPLLEAATQDDMLEEADKLLEMPMFYMSMMSVTAFVVAVSVVMSTMIMAVMERTREIGTLRALGASRMQILGTILAEIFILILIGGVPGTILSIPMAAVMETTLPTSLQLIQIMVFALVAGLFGGLYPAWRASRVVPMEAIRYE